VGNISVYFEMPIYDLKYIKKIFKHCRSSIFIGVTEIEVAKRLNLYPSVGKSRKTQFYKNTKLAFSNFRDTGR
jgi:hypothetical protein